MKFLQYQDDAIADLENKSVKLISKKSKKIVFRAPTGAGKTIMMAKFFNKLAKNDNMPSFCVIWLAPNCLHEQSHDKLNKYFANFRTMECCFYEDLQDNQIKERQILCGNWDKFNRGRKGIYTRDNEQENYFSKIIENTKNKGLKIIAIIDEIHQSAGTEISQDLINNDIDPDLIIGLSATPKNQNFDEMVRVHLEDVKAEEMIKKSVIINNGIDNLLKEDNLIVHSPTDEFILQQAIDTREMLAKKLKFENSTVNPLLCIQLPNGDTPENKDLRNRIEGILEKNNKTVENGKVAIYLADDKDKKNMENISHNNNEVEVMLFKQAIALGWDCPRAQILVLFREWKEGIFSTQTLGRILRMPEPEIGYYKDDCLNYGYVFTNKDKIHIEEEMSSANYIEAHVSKRISDYSPINLHSVYQKRQREKTRLTSRFSELFLEEANSYNLVNKINKNTMHIKANIISNHEIDKIDGLEGEHIKGNMEVNIGNEEELQNLFLEFIKNDILSESFFPERRSISCVKNAFYTFFNDSLGIKYDSDDEYSFIKIINIILDESNRNHFIKVMSDTKKAYIKENENKENPLLETNNWEIPESNCYGKNYSNCDVEKSVLFPFYVLDNEPKTEKEIIRFLENSIEIKWFYKNGESDSKHFGISYIEHNKVKVFYPDYVIQFKNGDIGIYDTKSGFTVNLAGNKSDALLKYIDKENAQNPSRKIHGGIIAPNNPKNYSEGWKVYTGQGIDIATPEESQHGWKWLEFPKETN